MTHLHTEIGHTQIFFLTNFRVFNPWEWVEASTDSHGDAPIDVKYSGIGNLSQNLKMQAY